VLTSWAKSAIACTLHGSGLLALERSCRPRPLILAYHQVVDDFRAHARSTLPAMLISTPMLERHLEWLGRRHRFVSLDEAAELAQRADARAGRAVAITFDDGYRQVYERAMPLLLRFGAPATVFVVSEAIRDRGMLVHDRLVDLLRRGLKRWRRPAERLGLQLEQAGVAPQQALRLSADPSSAADVAPTLLASLRGPCLLRLIVRLESELGPCAPGPHEVMTWEMLGAMQRAGFTIGSHTCSHVWMKNESPESLRREAAQSRREIEQHLGRPVEHFAYPGGSFDPLAVDAVAAAGYRFGYTICRHRDPARPRLTIPRRVFWERTCLDALERFSGPMMSCQTAGVFARCPGRHRREQAA
jgi:peptidoglycan/xylan/chitin deacetylase (PgdA/CDA1 family)